MALATPHGSHTPLFIIRSHSNLSTVAPDSNFLVISALQCPQLSVKFTNPELQPLAKLAPISVAKKLPPQRSIRHPCASVIICHRNFSASHQVVALSPS